MAKFLDGTGLSDLITKIKNAFVAKADTTAVTCVGVDSTPTASSTNLVTSGGVASALSGKQETLVSGTNIKTINSTSLLGSGDIAISANTPKATTIPSGGMLPNVYYNLGWIGTNTSFTKNETGLDSSILNIWAFGFDVDNNPTVYWPDWIEWANGTPPTLTNLKHYEVTIIGDYAMYAEFPTTNNGPIEDPD